MINTALMELRKMKRAKEDPIDTLLPQLDCDEARADEAWHDVSSPQEDLERSQTLAILSGAISRLPENLRRVLIMRDIEGRDTSAVATALALTETNVKVRLHRARCALRQSCEGVAL